MADRVFSGSTIKLNVSIDPIGRMSMEDYDFTVEILTTAAKSVSVPKAEAIRVDKNNYIVAADTSALGVGRLKCKVTALIPDEDLGGLRTEVVVVDTGIEIVKGV